MFRCVAEPLAYNHTLTAASGLPLVDCPSSGEVTVRHEDLHYDWNRHNTGAFTDLDRVEVHDETLRDGLQCPSAKDPSRAQKRRFIDLLEEIGVHSACVGLPGASERSDRDTADIVEHCQESGYDIQLAAAARTHPPDIYPIIDIAQKYGRPVTAMMFLGCSPIRTHTEGWTIDWLEDKTRKAVQCAVRGGIPNGFVAEDTTRTPPEALERLFKAAVDEGTDRLVLCDTCGHATPDGAYNLVTWTRAKLVEWGVDGKVQIDWHGHDDRGLSLINALYAVSAGADRVHGTVRGVGERVGNTPLELLILNLKLIREEFDAVPALNEITQLVAEAVDMEIPVDFPAFGKDAFRTATGVHAAAIVKALERGDEWLADLVYSAVPAHMVGRRQHIEVGHMSGHSNVRAWLAAHQVTASREQVDAVFKAAKSCKSTLSDDEIRGILAQTAHLPPAEVLT